jgi:hypothetical protein
MQQCQVNRGLFIKKLQILILFISCKQKDRKILIRSNGVCLKKLLQNIVIFTVILTYFSLYYIDKIFCLFQIEKAKKSKKKKKDKKSKKKKKKSNSDESEDEDLDQVNILFEQKYLFGFCQVSEW